MTEARAKTSAAGGKQIEAAADNFGHPFGNADRGRRHRLSTIRSRGQRAALFEKPHDLAQKQRVAFGLTVQRRCHPGGHRRPGGGDKHLHFLGAQSHEIDPHEMRSPRQGAQRVGQRMLARQFGRAIRPDDQNPAVGELGREKFEQTQRRRIGPMQIVEHQ